MTAAGRIEDAIAWIRRRAMAGRPEAMQELGRLLARAGHVDEAFTWLHRAAEAGLGHFSTYEAAEVLEAAGRVADGQRLRTYGWDLDGSIAQPWDAPLIRPDASSDGASS